MSQVTTRQKKAEIRTDINSFRDIDKVPPQSLEAEQSVLGAVLLDKDAIVKVVELLHPEHFYRPQHALIFSAIVKLYEKRLPADLITLTSQLKEMGEYENVGGSGYLSTLVAFVPTSSNIEHYANIVKDKAVKRQLITTSNLISELSYDQERDVKDLLDEAERRLFGISQDHLKQNFVSIKEALMESFDRLDELHKNKGGLRGVPTGFKELDKKLSGLQDNNLIILAARPSVGKTTLAMNIAQHAAVKDKKRVGIFSLEVSKEQLVDLMLASQADVDGWKITTGNLSDDDFQKISDAMGELAEAPLFIDDTPGISVMEMRTKARRLQIEHGVDMIVVDYLQLVKGRDLNNRAVEVSEISLSLKNLARELKVPVLALSQLNRAVESRTQKIPQLADLRESGSIEQDADVVMFLYREDNEDLETIKLSIAKHRSGALGELELRYKGERRRFYSIEKTLGVET